MYVLSNLNLSLFWVDCTILICLTFVHVVQHEEYLDNEADTFYLFTCDYQCDIIHYFIFFNCWCLANGSLWGIIKVLWMWKLKDQEVVIERCLVVMELWCEVPSIICNEFLEYGWTLLCFLLFVDLWTQYYCYNNRILLLYFVFRKIYKVKLLY